MMELKDFEVYLLTVWTDFLTKRNWLDEITLKFTESEMVFTASNPTIASAIWDYYNLKIPLFLTGRYGCKVFHADVLFRDTSWFN